MTSVGEAGLQHLQLSDLPDEILICILSLLPTTEDAVRTCLLLFKRSEQQQLWKSLTRLKFGEFDMLLIGSNFMNFVDRVMDLRDHSVPLVSFSLQCLVQNDDDADRIETWITQAVRCNVEELTLSIFDDKDDDDDYISYEMRLFPSCIFGCQSLVKLDLEFAFDVLFSVVCLPRLKYLRLYQVRLVNDESTEMLLSSPLLEVLIIHQCSWNQIESIRVSSPKLQVLDILDLALCFRYDDHRAKICIIGENLKHFSYTGRLKHEFWICASSSTQLTKVEIYVEKMSWDVCRINCCDILKGLYGARNLALSDYFLEGLQIFSKPLDIQVFECVTRLDIRVYSKEISIDSLVLMKIYERCPHLEYLNIGKLSITKRNTQLSLIPLCFQISLKKILVHYYVPGDDKADAAIDVLLKSALVLEELVIYCVMDPISRFNGCGRKIRELQNRFNLRPRVSKDCIISVRYFSRLNDYSEYYDKSLSES